MINLLVPNGSNAPTAAAVDRGHPHVWQMWWQWWLQFALTVMLPEVVGRELHTVALHVQDSNGAQNGRRGRLVREKSTLLLDGQRFCGIGLNIVDLLWTREGADCCHQQNNSVAFETAAARGFPFVRFAASPYYADDYWSLRDWRTDPERYWTNGMDRVVALARRLGGSTRLVPDLLWNPFAFADLCGEPLSALFNGSDTCTRRAVGEYVTQAARRYSGADEILFW